MTRRTKVVLILIGAAIVGAVTLPLLSILFVMYVAQPVRFSGTSMMPTYKDGELLMLDKNFTIDRGDVVAFRYPEEPTKSLIKRVLGLPGEQIEIRQGVVFIDGSILEEDYVSAENNRRSADLEPVVVPEGHVFVMGDNRDLSNDSRAWGPLPIESVYGEVWFSY